LHFLFYFPRSCYMSLLFSVVTFTHINVEILAWTVYFCMPSQLSWAHGQLPFISVCVCVYIYIYLFIYLVIMLINCNVLCFVCSLRILLCHLYHYPRTSLCLLIAECQTSTLCISDHWSQRYCNLLRHNLWPTASTGALPKWVASASSVLLDSSSVVLTTDTLHASGLTNILCNLKYLTYSWTLFYQIICKCHLYSETVRLFETTRKKSALLSGTLGGELENLYMYAEYV
jgi:hypothetical protein